MKKWSVESLTLVGVVLVWLLCACVACIAWHGLSVSSASHERIDNAHETLAWLGRFQADLYRAEIALQHDRTQIDADSARLRDAALARLQRTMAAAQRLSDDDGSRHVRLAAVQDLVRRQLQSSAPAGSGIEPGVLAEAAQMIEQDAATERGSLYVANKFDTSHQRDLLNSFRLLMLVVAGLTTLIMLKIRSVSIARRTAYGQLDHSQQRYRHLIETAHEGIWLLDAKGRSTFSNARLAQMLRTEAAQIQGRKVHEFLHESAHAALAEIFAVHADGASCSYDLCYRRADRSQGWAIVSGRPLHDSRGAFSGTLLMLTDITERKYAEQALASAHDQLEVGIKARTTALTHAIEQLRAEIVVRKSAQLALADSEQLLQAIVTMMPLALFLKDADSNIVLMNQACEDQWGVGFAEVSGTRAAALFTPDQMDRFLADDRAVFADGKMSVHEEEGWNAALHEHRRLQTYKKAVYHPDGAPHFLIGISIDTTERRRAEDALQNSFSRLRQLTAHLETIKEEERKRIARDIHDDLGQNLMALKIDVALLHARTAASHPRLNVRVTRVLETIDATIKAVRSIINDLHPSTLELGLGPAVEWLLKRFEERSGISGRLTILDAGVNTNLDNQRTAAIFRIIQESLVNVVRHANAREVQVTLDMEQNAVAIMIADDGVGMRPADTGKVASFGLRGIRERIDAFGGDFVIDSRWGTGTVLSILIPIEPKAVAVVA